MTDERLRESWWAALDDEILGALAGGRPATPAEIGERVGISEGAAASCLAMLAAEGRVRVCLVEIVGGDVDVVAPAKLALEQW